MKKLLADFVSCALVEQPVDVFAFAKAHFKGSAKEVVEPEDDLIGEGGEQDALADLDDMAGGDELTSYLKNVFESIDVDGSGTITKTELANKLRTDNEVQTLIEASGGSGEWCATLRRSPLATQQA